MKMLFLRWIRNGKEKYSGGRVGKEDILLPEVGVTEAV